MDVNTSGDKSKVLAAVSVSGLFASFCVYCMSFYGNLADVLFPLFALFLFGALALTLPIYVREYPTIGGPLFFWKFAHRMPNWVRRCEFVLVVIATAHFIWFAAHSGFGVPEVVNGQYVIDDHGRIAKVLTQGEYFALRGAALRMSMTITAVLYFLPSTYWWFLGNGKKMRASV